jgi:hypothetical protein
MWPFYLPHAQRTKILAYPFRSRGKRYVEGGITKSKIKHPRTLEEITSRFARHAFVIKHRPTTWKAYKYFFLELIKSPKRLIVYLQHKKKS